MNPHTPQTVPFTATGNLSFPIHRHRQPELFRIDKDAFLSVVDLKFC
jgi:hypothetical protein